MRISKTYTKDDFLPPIFKYFLHGYVLIYHSVLFQSNKVFTKLATDFTSNDNITIIGIKFLCLLLMDSLDVNIQIR